MSLKIFKDFVVEKQGQGQGLVNWSSRILEDNNTGQMWFVPRQIVQQHMLAVASSSLLSLSCVTQV